MNRPDFACTDLSALPTHDLRFLIGQMPGADGSDGAFLRDVEQLPDTLESMLTSDYVFRLIRDREHGDLILSPFLVFGVLLRRTLGPPRSRLERRVVTCWRCSCAPTGCSGPCPTRLGRAPTWWS